MIDKGNSLEGLAMRSSEAATGTRSRMPACSISTTTGPTTPTTMSASADPRTNNLDAGHAHGRPILGREIPGATAPKARQQAQPGTVAGATAAATERGNEELFAGDCLHVLRGIPAESVDAIVTDPPYGLNFMGKKWDYDVPSTEIWAECLRVLKPGGHLLSFAGTRTQHRMACTIEDAGFEIRDMIAWVYGSGFPKSKNLDGDWKGWGTALKPALEPITVARKPLAGTVTENVTAHGTGAINIAACRVPITSVDDGRQFDYNHNGCNRSSLPEGGKLGMHDGGWKVRKGDVLVPEGRWPANLIHDGSDDVLQSFPDAPGQQGAITGNEPTANGFSGAVKFGGMLGRIASNPPRSDVGSSARFFYCAKASKRDRDEGLDSFENRPAGMVSNTSGQHITRRDGEYQVANKANIHPTVKPTDLMRYLCRLITPPGGVVLDPFMGSGSTGKAAILEGFNFIGIEREAEYLEIAAARINAAKQEYADKNRQMDLGIV